MPDGAVHLRFDEILRNHGIIELSEYDCEEVHHRMDRDMMSNGGPRVHQERDPMHTEEGIREWIEWGRDSILDRLRARAAHGTPTVYDHKLGHFLRVCLGHVVLDKYWAKYGMYDSDSREKDIDEAIYMTFQTFLRHGYDKKRYRERT